MPLRVYPPDKRSPNCRIRGTVRGIPVDRSAGTPNLGPARELAARLENELLDRSIHGAPPEARREPTFADAVKSYLLAGERSQTTRDYLIPLTRHFGLRPLSGVTQAALDAYTEVRHPTGTKPATVVRVTIAPLVAVLRHAGVTAIFRRPKVKNARLRFLTETEAKALIKAAAPHLQPLIVFLLYTGARLSEAIYLDWEQVDLARRRVVFLDTKNGESRGIILHDEALTTLANLKGKRKGPVFRKADGYGYAVRRKSGGGQIKTGWASACRRAKIKNATPHTLRHTFASWLVMNGATLRAVADLLGHKSLAMVYRYSHMAPDHLDAAVQLLGGITGGQPQKRKKARAIKAG